MSSSSSLELISGIICEPQILKWVIFQLTMHHLCNALVIYIYNAIKNLNKKQYAFTGNFFYRDFILCLTLYSCIYSTESKKNAAGEGEPSPSFFIKRTMGKGERTHHFFY